MPRTAVNLPDPMQTQGDGALATDNNADDLLAQLAGEEVDRLLSEAEDAPRASSDFDLGDPARLNADHQDTDAADEAETSLNELFNELNDDAETTARAKAAPEPVAPPTPVQPPSAAEISVTVPSPAAPPVEPIAAAAVQPQPSPVDAKLAPPQPAPESAADALAAEMEEDALAHDAALRRMKGGDGPVAQAPAIAPAATPAAPTPAPAPDPETVAGLELVSETSGIAIDLQAITDQEADAANWREPFLVKVLEWLNAPLDGFSQATRAAIGKVALVTTLNAVGVFVYVLIFRRH